MLSTVSILLPSAAGCSGFLARSDHSLANSVTLSPTHPLMVHSHTPSLNRSLLYKSTTSLIRSFTHPSIHPFIYPSIHQFIHPFIHSFIHLPAQPPRALTISPTHFGSQLTDGSPLEEDEKPRDTEKISETKVPTSSVTCRSSAPMRYVHANKKQQHTVNRTHRPLSEFRSTHKPNPPPPLHLSISTISSKCYLQYPSCFRRQRDTLASSLVLITHSLTQSLSHQPIPSWFTRTLPLSFARSFTNPLPLSFVHSFIHASIYPSIHSSIHSFFYSFARSGTSCTHDFSNSLWFTAH